MNVNARVISFALVPPALFGGFAYAFTDRPAAKTTNLAPAQAIAPLGLWGAAFLVLSAILLLGLAMRTGPLVSLTHAVAAGLYLVWGCLELSVGLTNAAPAWWITGAVLHALCALDPCLARPRRDQKEERRCGS